MIKELLFLIKLLFSKVPKSLDIVYMKHFPFKGYAAMMWCGKLICKKEVSSITKTHELIHLKQAQVKGSWFKYYISYIWEYIKHIPVGYYANPYEMEAYANERNYEYALNYNSENINRYKIKNAVKIYKLNPKGWIAYIKSL